MKHLSLLLCCSFYGLSSISVGAINHERPNILWLTFEDTSAREFGCYGNKDVHTPNIDSLALRGIQFMNAWSVAPQSSAARSSLITGCYATTYGMDVHPIPYDTPVDIFFPQNYVRWGIIVQIIIRPIIILLQIIRSAGTNVINMRHTIVVDGKSISHFLLCLILLFLTWGVFVPFIPRAEEITLGRGFIRAYCHFLLIFQISQKFVLIMLLIWSRYKMWIHGLDSF